jgi:amino acid permease
MQNEHQVDYLKKDHDLPLLEHRVSLDIYGNEPELNVLPPLEKWRQVYFSPITQGSLRASIMCLLCVTLGSSLLSMPYTMKSLGVILGLIMFFITGFICHWTLVLVEKVAIKEKIYDYGDLVEKHYSKPIVGLTVIMCLVNNLGSVMAWNKFMMDIFSNLLEYYNVTSIMYFSPEYTKLIFGILIVLFIQVPICCSNSLGKLHVLSILGCLLILYVIIISLFEFPYFFQKNFSTQKIVYFNFDEKFLETICIFFFAFGNHSTIMNTISELHPKTDRRIKKLVNYTSYSEIFFYLITILVGYFSTYNETDEIYINREYQSIFMVVGKFLYMGVMICNVCLYYYMIKPYLEYVYGIEKEENDPRGIKHVLICILHLISLMLLSFGFTKITVLLGLLGASSQIYLIFIPILIYVKTFKLTFLQKIIYYSIIVIVSIIGVSHLSLLFLNQFFNIYPTLPM